VILLSVCTVADFGIVSLMCNFPTVSKDLTIASCSGWLLEQLLWSVYHD